MSAVRVGAARVGATAPDHVVIVPGALLLLPEYAGRTPADPALRERCVDVVKAATADAEVIAVVYASDRSPTTLPPAGSRVAAHLLDEALGDPTEVAPPQPIRLWFEVAWDAGVAECVGVGAEVAQAIGDKVVPVTLLVVADGSARRSEKAPGHLDPRAHGIDDAIVAAIQGARTAGLRRLLDLDPSLCADLLVHGRAPLQVMAAAVGAKATGEQTVGEQAAYDVVACEVSDPFGVLYVIAHLTQQ